MEALLLILIIVVLILINQLNGRIKIVDNKMNALLMQFKRADSPDQQVKPQEEPGPMAKPEPRIAEKPVVPPPPVEDKEEIILPQAQEIPKQAAAHSVPSARSIAIDKAIKQQQPVKARPATQPKPTFLQRNPDLEKFIGENLLSKVGIVIFVIGMGFLVKLGIDNNVITESMRVAIGIIIGGGMIGLAHYLRNSFVQFSSILIGGALAVLYFTIALAFHEYGLIPQTATFIIMVTITSFGVLLSIAYDRKALAVLSIIGGFGTPFFVSSGWENFTVMLTYILILDIGMLALVYFKKWNIINYLAYGFTYLLFASVYVSEFIGHEGATRLPLFLFLTSFYLIFYLMTIIYNVKNTKKFKYQEIGMLLSNSAIYFGLGLSLVHGYKGGLYSGLFTALTAIFNFGFAFALYKRKDIDKNLLFLLIGLVLTFVSLIAPIQLKGNYITMFWAIESVLLLWLSQKSGIKLLKGGSVIILTLMLISLIMDWQQNYNPVYDYIVLKVFLNKAFVASCVAMASLIGSILLLRQDEQIEIWKFKFNWKSIYVRVIFAVVLYLGFLLELNYQFIRFEFASSFKAILLGIYNFSFIILILAVKRVKPSELLTKSSFVLSGIAVVTYLTVYLQQITTARSYYLLQENVVTGYTWHYVLLALFILILIDLYFEIYKKYNFKSKEGTIAMWALAFIGVLVCSVEVGHISMLYQYGPDISEYRAHDIVVKSVYPVVWALTALGLMILGMKFRIKTLRITSLALFLITIIKLFFYDLAGNTTGKIVSFILLGIILLLISFLYQKLKFIIQDDETET